jgi:hypothetical protein
MVSSIKVGDVVYWNGQLAEGLSLGENISALELEKAYTTYEHWSSEDWCGIVEIPHLGYPKSIFSHKITFKPLIVEFEDVV